MMSLFKRTRNDNADHEIRRRIETRRGSLSPFGAPLNALKPLIS